MISEEKIKEGLVKSKVELYKLLDSVKKLIDTGDYNSAIEEIAVLNANIVACLVLEGMLKS